MRYRRLGKTGLKVSEVALGSWLTFGTATAREDALATVRRALELGINHFDCADVYGEHPGAAEEFLREALDGVPRHTYVLTTKAFWPVGDGPNDRGLSRKHIMESVNRSLRRLGTEYVDIFYCHRFDPETPLEETLGAIDDLIRQGKVLYAGISEWPAVEIGRAAEITRRLGLHPIAVDQPIYNLLDRKIESEVLPVCRQEGIGVVAFSPLAQGVLTGKYPPGRALPAGTRAADYRVNQFMQRFLTEENLERVERLRPVAKRLGLSLTQLALAWVLRVPEVASALVGATRPEQVEENVGAVGIALSNEDLEEINQAVA